MDRLKIIESMQESPIHDYILSGVTSTLLTNGKVRMFEANRYATELVWPHSHRYDLACYVLQGRVTNHIYQRVHDRVPHSDRFLMNSLEYAGVPGEYDIKPMAVADFVRTTTKYLVGEWYSMASTDIHSIEFSRGTKVLVFEGPQVSKESISLTPLNHKGERNA